MPAHFNESMGCFGELVELSVSLDTDLPAGLGTVRLSTKLAGVQLRGHFLDEGLPKLSAQTPEHGVSIEDGGFVDSPCAFTGELSCCIAIHAQLGCLSLRSGQSSRSVPLSEFPTYRIRTPKRSQTQCHILCDRTNFVAALLYSGIIQSVGFIGTAYVGERAGHPAQWRVVPPPVRRRLPLLCRRDRRRCGPSKQLRD